MVSEVEAFLLCQQQQLQLPGCLVLVESLVFLKSVFSSLPLASHCLEAGSASAGQHHQEQNETTNNTEKQIII